MPIELDSFQKEAIDWIEKEHSVLVSAPTGSGKTLIAEWAIEKAISKNENVIYTAPIKALSNQKYRDFRVRFGDHQVGILTGDVAINTEAPILIMTSEIYRNSLFESPERIKKIGWVIFDEVHYLDDEERGTVWEEALLFTPLEIRILSLSATIPNARELAHWIQSIHQRPIAVIEEKKRPVPLYFLFQCQGKIIEDFKSLRRDGYYNREDWKVRRKGHKYLRSMPNRLDQLLKHLQDKQRMPAIYFVFNRRKTELLAREASRFSFLNEHERNEIRTLYLDLLNRYDLVSDQTARRLLPLIEKGIAYHHAGLLPTMKEVLEQLFTSKLVKIIFTTETFALGINMPARSVIFDELGKFYGYRYENLSTRDFFQMAGRAGRRGMDERGFVYSRVNPNDISFLEIQRIIQSSPERIQSQLNTTYATLLNLYKKHRRDLLKIYPQTFHYFQSLPKERKDAYRLMERKLNFLEEMGYIKPEGLTLKGEFAAAIFGYELLLSQMHHDGFLNKLSLLELCILLAALVFEPRKADKPPHLSHDIERLRIETEQYWRFIHKQEIKYHLYPYTKPPHFHLAPAVEAWIQGSSFKKSVESIEIDEGELVRCFRMIIQLLRELAYSTRATEELKHTANRARQIMNRDVIDAEKQLRA